MDSREFYPSRWLKAEDVGEKKLKVTINMTKGEEIGEDKKLVLFFDEHEKGLVLNRTNHDKIVDAYGSETDNWKGRQLELFTALVAYKGNEVPAIRLNPIK